MRKNLAVWLDYITALHPKTIELGLTRVSAVAERLNLQLTAKVITVTGTNGKGSCVRFLESIYLAANYQVAAYTSPHLIDFNERIRCNGMNVSDAQLILAFEKVETARGEITLTFFEFTTLAALLILQEFSPNVIILEVGLGGRLDAVNIIDADLAIVTTIDLDHTDWLGPTREDIAREKAGIFRANKPVVYGDPNPPQTLLQAARDLNSPIYCFKKDYDFQAEDGEPLTLTLSPEYWGEGINAVPPSQQQKTIHMIPSPQYSGERVRVRGVQSPIRSPQSARSPHPSSWTLKTPTKIYQNLPVPKLKLQNAATSLMAIEVLQNQLPVSREAIEEGLKKATLPARFEAINQPANIIFDVAHNPQATAWLAEQCRQKNQRFIAVVGMLKDKIVDQTLEPMQPLIDHWFVGGLDVPRGGDSAHILAYFSTQKLKNWYNFATIEQAFAAALEEAKKTAKTLLVFGSFYTVAAAKQCLRKSGVSV